MSALRALREECEEVSRALGALVEEDFARPTRCTEWDVKELAAHIYRDIDNIQRYLTEPAPMKVTHDSATYFIYDPVAEAPGVAARAKALAASFVTGAALTQAWDAHWPAVLAEAEAADPHRPIATFGPTLELEEYLRTRVLEIVVHRMDLEAAFGRPCWGTDEAVGIVDEILVDLLGKEPPHELDWDVVEFIERATGRVELTDEERTLLGVRAAKRFPLIA